MTLKHHRLAAKAVTHAFRFPSLISQVTCALEMHFMCGELKGSSFVSSRGAMCSLPHELSHFRLQGVGCLLTLHPSFIYLGLNVLNELKPRLQLHWQMEQFIALDLTSFSCQPLHPLISARHCLLAFSSAATSGLGTDTQIDTRTDTTATARVYHNNNQQRRPPAFVCR